MSIDSKTVTSETTSLDLYVEQEKDVALMRASLLNFNRNDPNSGRKALQNVTILRVYHQLKRIVRFTELMDRLEDRIYQSIEAKLDNSDPDDDSLYLQLIPIQERLQETMIQSHKLLQPYLDIEQLAVLDVPKQEDPANSFTSIILDQESREKVRTGVQQLLDVINTIDSDSHEVTDTSSVQSKAQEALAKLDDSTAEIANA